MPTTIAIICTLDEVIPYSLADAANRYFSLNLSVALRGDAVLPAGAVANLLQPWKLKFGTDVSPLLPSVYVDAGAAGSVPSGKKIDCTVVSPATPAVTQVTTRLGNRFQAAIDANNLAYFNWDDDPNATSPPATFEENWSRLVAHASTYTAPVPHSLNLAVIFKVAAGDITGQTRLFVAPIITDGTITYAPKPAPDNPSSATATWTYSNPPTGFSMSAVQPEYLIGALPDPKKLPTPHFIDPNTYWIATSSGKDEATPPEAAASEDWRRTLEHRAGEAFDLAQRILVLLRATYFPEKGTAPIFPTFGDVDLMRDAILSALRDTADFGLRYGPDGTNLLRFVFQRAVLRNGVPPDPTPFEAGLKTLPFSLNSWTGILTSCGISVSSLADAYLKKPIGIFASRGAPGAIATPAYMRATLDMLDSIQTALATDSILATVLLTQWVQALPALFTSDVEAAVQTALSLLTAPQPDAKTVRSSRILRRRMLLANMGGSVPGSAALPIWTALTNTPHTGYQNELADVTGNLEDLIPSYFRGRFDITLLDASGLPVDPNAQLFSGRMPDAKWPGTPTVPSPDLSAGLKADATTFAADVLFPAPNDQAKRSSHPVIIQIGDTTDAVSLTPLTDNERKVAGMGLLIREGSGLWTCADIANLYIGEVGKPNVFDLLLPHLIVPIRLHTRNKLKQPILVYNNASLVGQDPDDATSSEFPGDGAAYPSESKPDWDQMFQFRLDWEIFGDAYLGPGATGQFLFTIPSYTAPTGDTLEDWKRIPALKVGLTYSLLPFVVGNSGALPPLLASLADPFTPVTPNQFAASWTGMAGYVRTVKYLRRVGVGAPRIRAANADVQQDLPAIPPTVVPLARDFGSDSQTPVLLLYNDGTKAAVSSNFKFQLRPPACDLETWDRWVAGLGPTYRNTRISVATAVTSCNSKSVDDPKDLDLSLDDPAVTSLTFSLIKIYPPPGSADVVTPVDIKMPPLTALGASITGPEDQILTILMKPVQFDGFTVACSIGGNPTLKPNGNGVTVSIPEGQVWRLSAAATVLDVGKFEGIAAGDLGGSFDLLIEAASADIFAPQPNAAALVAFQKTLWESLTVSFANSQVQASLTPWGVPGDANTSRDLIRHIDLRRQVWRWMGRPIAPLPADWVNTPPMSILDADPPDPADSTAKLCSRVWEVGSFGERPDDDSAISETTVNFARPNNPKQVPDKFTNVALYSSDVSSDPRAQYYRFGIDVHSRYEDLPRFSVVPIRAQINVVKEAGFTRWVRGIVPPRNVGEIPKPKVLLVIPMTEPATGDTSLLPDLLVIANEEWFTIGGLAEELYAELDLARDPNVPLSTPTLSANPMPELGPNPILSQAGLDYKTNPFAGTAAPADPVGTTFDQNSTAALFGNTCFRLKSSMLSSVAPLYFGAPPPSGLEHFEAKIRFRRVINGEPFGLAMPLVQSDLTEAFHVEFQSSFVHCVIAKSTDPLMVVPTSSLAFSVTSGGQLQFQHGTDDVTPKVGPPVSPQLQLWALVMRNIHDVTGAIQTSAVDILGPDFQGSITDSRDLVVYLLEVLVSREYTGKFDSGIAKAAALLFPTPSLTSPNPNAMARINRCSPAIAHKP